MLNRRGLLRMAAALPAVAAAGSVRQAADAMGVGTVTGQTVIGGRALSPRVADAREIFHRALWRMRQRSEQQARLERAMPPHIASMKSWSPAYRNHIAMKEWELVQAYCDRLEEDQEMMRKAMIAFGLNPD